MPYILEVGEHSWDVLLVGYWSGYQCPNPAAARSWLYPGCRRLDPVFNSWSVTNPAVVLWIPTAAYFSYRIAIQ